MREFYLLGHSNNALSIILDTLSECYDDVKVKIINNHPTKDNNPYLIDLIETTEYEYSDSLKIDSNIKCIIAGMTSKTRLAIYKFFEEKLNINTLRYESILHPSAIIPKTVKLGMGLNVSPNVTIAPYAYIDDFVSINRQVTIGHHTKIGKFVTLNPNSNIAGNCDIGENVTIGMGSNIVDEIKIGKNSIIGAGSLVTKSIPDNVIAYGSPAKIIRRKLRKFPLCIGSEIEVYDPDIEFFMNKIDNKESFSFVKENHGFWDVIVKVFLRCPELEKMSEINVPLIAEKMTEYRKNIIKRSTTYKWYPSERIYNDVLNMIINEKPDNFYFGLSDMRGIYTTDVPEHDMDSLKGYTRVRQRVMKKFVVNGYIPFNGISWKRYDHFKQLTLFLNKYKDHKIVMVGPKFLEDFGKRTGLNNFSFITIHENKASMYAESYLDDILDFHYKMCACIDTYTIYLFVGGSVATWLITKLHNKLKNTFLLDIGTAMHSYYKKEEIFPWLKK